MITIYLRSCSLEFLFDSLSCASLSLGSTSASLPLTHSTVKLSTAKVLASNFPLVSSTRLLSNENSETSTGVPLCPSLKNI